ncbi:MAG TPA: VOC family protein [Jatrophihabitans sp.]|nr:VOC family protein [Jatrophihabitans sp.]
MSLQTVIYPVRDLEASKAVFTAYVGTEPYMDEPYYVGYRADGVEIGLDPNGHSRGLVGGVWFRPVDDIGAAVKTLLDAGAESVEEAHDVGGGRKVATVKDPAGNVIGFMQDA